MRHGVPSQLAVIISSPVQPLRLGNPALLPNTTWCCVDSPDLVEHLVVKRTQRHSRGALVYSTLECICFQKLRASNKASGVPRAGRTIGVFKELLNTFWGSTLNKLTFISLHRSLQYVRLMITVKR